ncbi:MAG TPA: isochorismatase family cysteine hydrolase [Azospirillaceae bacterium]|nr:isochorismatase family cysteine hydrolase [Azospirillaceae bacterium]
MDLYCAPDWAHAALVTVDVQQDYARDGAKLNVSGVSAILPAVGCLAQAFRSKQLPIIHVVRFYKEHDDADLPRRSLVECGRAPLQPGTLGADIVDELKPVPCVTPDPERLMNGSFQAIGPNEWLMYKPRWGAFYRTKLEHHLKDMGVNTVVLCGASFPNGTRTTIYQASERDFRVVLATDAVSGFYPKAAEELADIGVNLMTADECAAKVA